MFGFGKKKSIHHVFLHTVEASHVIRVNFLQIWNRHCHVANLDPLSRGDEELVKIFDIYNRFMNSLILRQNRLGDDPSSQMLPTLMYYSMIKKAYQYNSFEEFDFQHDEEEKEYFEKFNFTNFMPIGKQLLEDYTSFQKSYSPFVAFGEETVAYTRYFIFEMKKFKSTNQLEEFVTFLVNDFKSAHIKIWKQEMKDKLDWNENYTFNNETNDFLTDVKEILINGKNG